MKKKVQIIQYSAGNLFNVARAFEHLGCEVAFVAAPGDLKSADFLVLPGVGAFGDGIASLRESGMADYILDWVAAAKPFLGICLGMQLLFSDGEEFGRHDGLGIIPGRVLRLPPQIGMKVPNIGWYSLTEAGSGLTGGWGNSVLEGITPDQDMYFVHSYAGLPDSDAHWLAKTSYGNHEFCSAVRRGNVFGCQFHPEKSGPAGLSILDNFLKF